MHGASWYHGVILVCEVGYYWWVQRASRRRRLACYWMMVCVLNTHPSDMVGPRQ